MQWPQLRIHEQSLHTHLAQSGGAGSKGTRLGSSGGLESDTVTVTRVGKSAPANQTRAGWVGFTHP